MKGNMFCDKQAGGCELLMEAPSLNKPLAKILELWNHRLHTIGRPQSGWPSSERRSQPTRWTPDSTMQDGVSVAEISVKGSNWTGLQNGDCNTGSSGGDGSSQLYELVKTSSTNKTGRSCSDPERAIQMTMMISQFGYCRTQNTVSLHYKDKLVNAVLKNCMLIRVLRTSAGV
jgi:hypothetical protein